MTSDLDKTSKFLSFILRHQPEAVALNLDSQGWADIDELIARANEHGQSLSRAIVERVVQTSDKKRFTVSDDGLRIRAAQGHSSGQVQLSHTERTPPEVLYHGTASRFVEAIKAQGLKPGSRHYVHLSDEVRTAAEVGRRYGKPVVLTITAFRMSQEGFKFYLADNGVWLTAAVPALSIDFD